MVASESFAEFPHEQFAPLDGSMLPASALTQIKATRPSFMPGWGERAVEVAAT
jgi:hypothetical protein